MYCTKCGKLLENGVCPNCGQTETNQPNEQTQYNGVAQQPVQSPVQPSIQQTAQTPIQQGYPQPQYAQQPNGYYPPAEPDKSNAGLNLYPIACVYRTVHYRYCRRHCWSIN